MYSIKELIIIHETLKSLTEDQLDYLAEGAGVTAAELRMYDRQEAGTPAEKRKKMIARLAAHNKNRPKWSHATAGELRMYDRQEAGTPAEKRKKMIARVKEANQTKGNHLTRARALARKSR